MTIKEVENLTGLAKANIRFYEAQGLVMPQRGENSYRIYSETDVQELGRIRLLRSLDVPLDAIRSLQLGERELEEVLTAQLATLGRTVQNLTRQQALCRYLLESGVSYGALDPAACQPEPQQLPEPVLDLRLPLQLPLRRFLARMLDLLLYGLPWYLILQAVAEAQWQRKLVIPLLVMPWLLPLLATHVQFRVEPWLLHLFGTTPGKWLLGLYVTDEQGGKLSVSDAKERTWDVYSRGLGWGLPVYSLVRLGKSFAACCMGNAWDELPWENWTVEQSYAPFGGRLDSRCVDWFQTQQESLENQRKWRIRLRCVGVAVLAALVLWCAWLFRPVELPPVGGEITIREMQSVADAQGHPDIVWVEYIIPLESELHDDFVQLLESLEGRYSLEHHLPGLYDNVKSGRSVNIDYRGEVKGSLICWTVFEEETAWLYPLIPYEKNSMADVWFPGWSFGGAEDWFARLDELLAQAEQYRTVR